MPKEIQLTKGYVAIVDDKHYEELSKYRWRAMVQPGGVCAIRSEPRDKDGRKKTVYMHRQITDAPNGMEVDHANHNSLDNQDANLRVCTCAQNQANRIKHVASTSRFKGVYWSKESKRWCAQITIMGRRIHLGYFHNERDAAKVYNLAAIKHSGEFAHLNAV